MRYFTSLHANIMTVIMEKMLNTGMYVNMHIHTYVRTYVRIYVRRKAQSQLDTVRIYPSQLFT